MKNKINNLQLVSIFFLLLFSCTLGILPYVLIRFNGIDAYISVLIGIIIGIIPMIVILYIFNYDIDKPILEKTKIIFGKVLGNIINIILILLYTAIATTMLFNISNFIISQYLTNTPITLVIIIFGLTALYTSNKGINTISKISLIYLICIIILFILALIGLIPEVKLDNLKPIMEFGFKRPLLGGFIYTIILLSPANMLLLIPKNDIENNKKTTKYLIITYLITSIMIFIIALVTSSVLGKYLLQFYQYPTYITLKRISIFGFIDRIENFLSIEWILSSFIIITMAIYGINSSIKKNNSKIFNFSIVVIIIILTKIIFKNNTYFNNYLTSYYIYILLFMEVIYLIIFIIIFIKKGIKKKN